MLRKSTLEAFDGKSQSLPRFHITHCLDALRDDVICNADDIPRYTGRRNEQASVERPISGIGQARMCKDWSKLKDWAVKHTACYKNIHSHDWDFPPAERYKFCPDGQTLWPLDSVA